MLADKEITPLNLHEPNRVIPKHTWNKLVETETNHGKHPHIVENENAVKQNAYTWLRKG